MLREARGAECVAAAEHLGRVRRLVVGKRADRARGRSHRQGMRRTLNGERFFFRCGKLRNTGVLVTAIYVSFLNKLIESETRSPLSGKFPGVPSRNVLGACHGP